ncbi:hypothetical protein B0293_32875 [Amycolatopsis azurea DSM 43854]|uniref:Uncharacterized protein n=2 Tax=Amycolatopsis azurea DSM 43854 TaxID=1238180 RepID=A0ABX3J4U9_9PSEU|nr:hypothetical protein B0293_32875 [Amycolatopsis azurea DSM 43854]
MKEAFTDRTCQQQQPGASRYLRHPWPFTLMSAGTRATFRAALDVDAAVSPRFAAQTTRQITQALLG